MPIDQIHLWKLLYLLYSKPNIATSKLKSDIREYKKKSLPDYDPEAGGGDFYSPFWADAKLHVKGVLNLEDQMKIRIDCNFRRKRLYPLLTLGFLSWWEKSFQKNQQYKFMDQSLKNKFVVSGVGAVKVESLLCLDIEDGSQRIIYPYFSESPELSSEAARLGLHVLSKSFTNYEQEDIRILDIIRGKSFRMGDAPLQGNEAEILTAKYTALAEEWKFLWGDEE